MAGEELEQQPAELPEGWKVARLGDMISLRGGLSYKGEFLSDSGNSLVTMGCVSASERFKKSGLKRYSGDFTERHRLRVGDMVIATRDVTQNRELLGSPALVPEGLPGEAVIAATNLYMVANHSESPTEFLYWLMKTPAYRNQIVASAKGTTIVMLTKDSVENFTFPLPPLAEQKAIAAVLGALDDKIELNRRMNATMEAMARALFQSWFVDFDPVRAKLDGRQPTGLDNATAAVFPDHFQESPLGPIPHGWELKTLKDLTSKIGSGATPRGGSSVYVDDGVALIRSQNIHDFDFRWEGLARLSESSAADLRNVEVKPGDVLINITGDSILRTCVVEPAVLPARVNQHVAIIRAIEPAHSRYLHHCMVQPRMKEFLMGLNAGATRPAVTKGHLESITILLPPSRVLNVFDQAIAPIYRQTEANRAQSRTLVHLRDSLLPKLLNGHFNLTD